MRESLQEEIAFHSSCHFLFPSGTTGSWLLSYGLVMYNPAFSCYCCFASEHNGSSPKPGLALAPLASQAATMGLISRLQSQEGSTLVGQEPLHASFCY